ncbi:MAG: hypothetical protein GXP55_11915 [Deltaproteobacteria bacterium]|nr:hypothetical protein [Deltaproteobacteria bacterium]
MNTGTLGMGVSLAVLLGACGGGGHTANDAGPGPDANMMDAMVMGDGSFDPNMTYPGEGDPCEFSILCGDQQLCVDDTCIRHERLDPANVQILDYRVLFSDADHPTPLGTDAEHHWLSHNYHSYLFPGHDGPALVFFAHTPTSLEIAVYDDHFRTMHVDGMWVTALGYSPDGLVIAGGADNVTGRPRLVMFDHEDQLIFDELTPESLDAEVQADPVAPPDTAMLGVPQSFLWNGDHFEVAFALGDATNDPTYIGPNLVPSGVQFLTHRPPTHTILGELTIAGDVSLKALAGELLVPGARAWLVQDDRGVGVVLSQGLSTDRPYMPLLDITTKWHSVDGEESELIVADVGGAAMYYQPSPRTWYYIYESIADGGTSDQFCSLRGFRSGMPIGLMADERFCESDTSIYEGISLSSQYRIFHRVFRENDPFLTKYRSGGSEVLGIPDRMSMDRYSSNGEVEEVVVPFLAPRDCLSSGFNGFPVARFDMSYEVLITEVNNCYDTSVSSDSYDMSLSSLGLVEGHLVTGG